MLIFVIILNIFMNQKYEIYFLTYLK